ncbi:hypothetical protein AJ78_03248 [Emergomyces pasteurianus Ep9510]|uniref:Uncharacterized protein n=1 Tax=Emergomyces pasteurianus Ep9510 TaxID=1447872 RepID=A0A1J9PJE1_9EURO|nr:hypothetical protein AJ78_03248 [Emergomyces pasteurianus Ep9510]
MRFNTYIQSRVRRALRAGFQHFAPQLASLHLSPVTVDICDAAAIIDKKSAFNGCCREFDFYRCRTCCQTRTARFSKKEAVSGEIELDDDPRLISNATATLGEVENNLSSPLSSGSYYHLSFHVLMYSLAERLFIHGLKHLSKQNVERELNQHVEGDTFLATILEIYKTTPEHDRALRNLIVDMTIKHLTPLRRGDNRLTSSLESDIITQAPEFSRELLIALMDRWTLHLSGWA